MYHPRTLEKIFLTLSKQFPVLLVTGPRQVGKTTFLNKLAAKSRAYVSLDDPFALALAVDDPRLFFERYPPPVIIDEIQYAPGLLPYIKMMVDAKKRTGQFWITGSQQFALMKGVTESLAGRVGIINLLGFSMAEAAGAGAQQKPFLPLAKYKTFSAFGQV
jgi:predicted AAA+ superfamily ATPase